MAIKNNKKSNTKKNIRKSKRTMLLAKKTFKNNTLNSSKKIYQEILNVFMQMLTTIKLYHWKTSSYAQHKATDELYTNLNTNIDSFVEIMLGKTGGRVNLAGQKTLPLLDYTNLRDFKSEVEKYKKFLMVKRTSSSA